MRRFLFVLIGLSLLSLSPAPATSSPQAAQPDLLGPWDGEIVAMGLAIPIRIVFSETGGALGAAIDIPQQGAHGVALTSVRRAGATVHFELPAGPGLAIFDGTLEGDTISGKFTQGPAVGTFKLARGKPEAAKPATPKAEPPPYREEEVKFSNGDVTLAGTLTIPQGAGPFPAVILLTGSGPQNRDEELFGFKPFRIIADHLTRRGVAVLRYDDRGVGGSTGKTADATTESFAGDALAALALLAKRPDIQPARIGMLGHSEGGIVAAIAASRTASRQSPAGSPGVSFIVMLAGTALPGEQIIRAQAESIARAAGASDADLAKLRAQQDLLFKAVRSGQGWDEVIESARKLGREQIAALPEEKREAIPDPEKTIETAIQAQLVAAKSPWYRFFIDYDPAQALAKVTCPVLALFGSLDTQVPAEMNRKALEAALKQAGNKDVTTKVYDGANHLFIEAVTGSPAEYSTLKKEFVPGLLDEISGWIQARTK